MLNRKIWVATVNIDGIEMEYEWNMNGILQKSCSKIDARKREECSCPCGDDEVLGYMIDGLLQDTHNIKENKYGYRDFSSLLKVLGVKNNI